jgi:glycosyl transferase family 25
MTIGDIAPLRVFLINLDRSPERLAFMQAQFDRLGITVERIAAVDGASVPAWLRDEFGGAHQLTPGEVGCYASHLLVAQRVVAEGLPFAIVLEDDATLDDAFLPAARAAARAAPQGWDYIHLCSVFKRSIVCVAELSATHKLIRYERQPVSTAAYVVSNAGARKWLNPMRRVRPNDMDNRYAWVQGLDVYGVFPAIARQTNNFASDVGHTPCMKETRSWSPGIGAEIYSHVWAMRQIGVGAYFNARALNYWNSLRKRLDGRRRVAVVNARKQKRPAGNQPATVLGIWLP